jgi:hypothetical protein
MPSRAANVSPILPIQLGKEVAKITSIGQRKHIAQAGGDVAHFFLR